MTTFARPVFIGTNYLRRDGGNTITGVITADGDATRDFGSSAVRFRRFYGRAINVIDGVGTRASAGYNSILGGRNFGYGTNIFRLGGGSYPPVGMLGNVYSYNATASATMSCGGGGSFVVGSAFAYRVNDVAEIICDPTSFGSFTGGYAYPYAGSSGATSRIRNSEYGAFIWAYPAPSGGVGRVHEARAFGGARGAFLAGRTVGTGDADIHANGAQGSFTLGFINASAATATGRIRSLGDGAFTQGQVVASTAAATAEIRGSGAGAFAQGSSTNQGLIHSAGAGAFAQGLTSNQGQIYAGGLGSLARGRAAGGQIRATNSGSFAAGFVGTGVTGRIESTGAGAFAMGDAAGTGIIRASGSGSFAIGDVATGYLIEATMQGSFAMGDAANANIRSVQRGALAFGYTDTYQIYASGYGNLAFGCSDTAAIEATGNDNSFQFGPGTNAVAKSLQVGSATAGSRFGPDGRITFDGSFRANVTVVTGTSHTAAEEHVILVDDDTAGSTVTVTLPPVAGIRTIYHIKKLGTTANVIIDGNAAETIDGALTQTLSTQYDSLMIISDGTAWFII